MAIVAIGAALTNGCGGSSPPATGTEGGHCYGNATCNAGLACFSDLCVNPNPIDASAATGGRGIGGATGAGGGKAGGASGSAGTNGTGAAGAGGAGACSGLATRVQSCLSFAQLQKLDNEIDILFMVDDSSSMNEMQQKLYLQLPLFIQVLQSLPTPPSLHVAVVSSDMGAPGDATSSIMCTKAGDQGQFQSMPRGTCTATTLTAGDTFISDADNMPNYTDPIANVFQCIAPLGDKGCGFENQLASIDRALGGDGQQPSTNAKLSAARGLPRHRHPDQRGRLLGTRQHPPLLSERRPAEHRQPARPHRELPLQPVRPLCTDPMTGVIESPPMQPPSDTMMTGTTRRST